MCIFSGPVEVVADTSIFARGDAKGRQVLVYAMRMQAQSEVAMVLPVPYQRDATEAFHFVNMEVYPDFFDDLKSGFPVVAQSLRAPGGAAMPMSRAELLPVEKVGSYVASFVPAAADFARLDPQFRLPDAVWKQLPDYRDWGFAVFKLAPGQMRVHPMAFLFMRREPRELFFPTVHVHDGRVHETAEFSHALYCQLPPDEPLPHQLTEWEESPGLASSFMKVEAMKKLLIPDAHCYRKELAGVLPNRDTRV